MVRKLSGGWHKWPSTYNPAANAQAANVAHMLKNAEWHRDDWRAGYCEAIADNWLEGRHLPRAISTSVREAIAKAVRLETEAIQIPEAAGSDPADLLAYRARVNALADFADHADTRLAAFFGKSRKNNRTHRWRDPRSGGIRKFAVARRIDRSLRRAAETCRRSRQ